MREILGGTAKALEIPGRVAGFAEEYTAHIVVESVNLMALAVEMLHSF
jgi:hypothetical protein